MKKILITALMFVLFSSMVSATFIGEENIVIDLEHSTVEIEAQVNELTGSDFTYLTTYPVTSVEGFINGERTNCTYEELIECEVNQTDDFTVDLIIQTDHQFHTLQEGNIRTFQYNQPIYRPTNTHRLEVLLPPGSALINENESLQNIEPEGWHTSSDGRKISVNWENEPNLGETLRFRINYEHFVDNIDLSWNQLLPVAGLMTLILIIYLLYTVITREKLENLFNKLEEDEKEILEELIANEGEMLQKDLVEQLDYSKAKISGTVSELVEKDVLVKEKEGRSNKLKINRKYTY